MTSTEFKPLFNVSLATIEDQIRAYSWYPDLEYISLERLDHDMRGVKTKSKASLIGNWLTRIEILEESEDKKNERGWRRLTERGRRLAVALRERDQEGVEIFWRDIVLSSKGMSDWFKIHVKGQASIERIAERYVSNSKGPGGIRSGITAIIEIFKAAGLCEYDDDDGRYEPVRAKWALSQSDRRDEIDNYQMKKKALHTALNAPYVHPDLLEDLERLQASPQRKFDLLKLIDLCRELNACYKADCRLATAMLVRAIMDHIPPVFMNCNTFSDIANNYAGGSKSFKEHMQKLEALRKISDGFLHTHIRRTESLPTRNQIDFRQSLEALLSEIIRVLKQP